MDIPQVLEVLVPDGNWGPCAQSGVAYADFAAGWRLQYWHAIDPEPPTEAEMLTVWADLESTRAERELSAVRNEALPTLATRADVTGVQVRAVADAIQTLTNDRLTFLFAQVATLAGTTPEALEAEFGRPARVLAPEILGYIAAHPMAGDPTS